MDEKKLISQLYCKIRNDNKTSKSIINDSYRKLKHNLCKIYKTMDVDFDSEMLKVMDEVIIYCSIEQNRCAMACQGCGAVLFLLKKQWNYFP